MKLIVKPVAIHLAFLSAIAFADNADFRMTTLSSFTTAYSLAIDQTDGSIYIWGQASSDMILLKMRANGTIAWQSYYEASGATLSAGDVTGISPVIDPQSGDIFVHGRTTGVMDSGR
jgi:hypothetical protein